jgi:hypothetical protein
MMTRRTVTMATMVTMVMACGPDRISHGDGDGTGDPASTDDAGSGTGGADTSTGDPPPPMIPGDGPYGAGTRLRPVVERTEDGVTQLLHWYDSELGIDCEFARDSVGTQRCLPLAVVGGAVGFDDEACTVPVVGIAQCGTVASHVRGIVPGAAACTDGPRHQAYLRGEPIGAGDVGRFDAGNGSCAAFGASYGERYALSPVADEEFLAGTAVVETRGNVRVRAIVADDGAFVRDRIVHPRSGTVCSPWGSLEVGGDVLGCDVPSATSRGFSDAACTSALYDFPDDGTCEPSSLSIIWSADEWYLLGERWDEPVYALDIDDACAPAEALAFEASAFHEIGESIAPVEGVRYGGAFVPDDAGRLRRFGIAGDGETLVLPGALSGLPEEAPRWYDSLLEQTCSPAADDEGTQRCMPLPFVRPNRLAWGDPGCTETPLYETVKEVTPSRISRATVDDCGVATVESLQNVVGPWDGPVYRVNDGACEPEEISDIENYYQLGNYAQLFDAPVLELATDG